MHIAPKSWVFITVAGIVGAASMLAAPQPFVTGQILYSPKTNFVGYAGMGISTGPSTISISSLGRMCAPGNSQQHVLKLVVASTGIDLAGGTVTINMAGCTPGQYKFANLPSAILLQPNTPYFVVSQENTATDTFYDYGPVNVTNAANENGSVYNNGSGYNQIQPSNYSFGPVNFQYSLNSDVSGPVVVMTAPSNNATVSGNVTLKAFVTDILGVGVASVQFNVDGLPVGAPVTSGVLGTYSSVLDSTKFSNGPHTVSAKAFDKAGNTSTAQALTLQFSNGPVGIPSGTGFITTFYPSNAITPAAGFYGFSFIIGSQAIQISSLGRYVLSGNQFAHTLKLVRADTFADVAGTTTTLNINAALPGMFQYAPLAQPVTLPPGTGYYVVSSEGANADTIYNSSPVSYHGEIASVTGPVQQVGGNFTSYPNPNSSFVPLDFQYSIPAVDAVPPNVTINGIANAQTINPGFSVTATASDNIGVVGVQWYVDNVPYDLEKSTAPYGTSLTLLISGSHTLTAVARDAAGNKTTSTAVQFVYYDPNPIGIFPQLLKSYTLTTQRNNQTGFFGLKFSLPALQSVTGVGRICVAGNNQTHVVKVIRVSDGTTMLMGSVNMAGCIPGTMQFQLIPGTSLPAGTYYLVGQETNGGDKWYDIGPASSTLASILAPVYYDGSHYVEVGYDPFSYLNTSYGPYDLSFHP